MRARVRACVGFVAVCSLCEFVCVSVWLCVCAFVGACACMRARRCAYMGGGCGWVWVGVGGFGWVWVGVSGGG